MPSESIIFDPEINERQLNRETDKVNDAFAETGDIDPSIGGDLDLPGGPSELGDSGGGETAGIMDEMNGKLGGLSEKLPSSVGAVSAGAAAALPIAIAGGVGAGLLKAMTGASARLQTTGNILGIALNTFFRPWGNALDKVIRPFANEALSMAQTFNDIAREDGLGVALGSITQDVAGSIGSAIWKRAKNIGVSDLFFPGGLSGFAKAIDFTGGFFEGLGFERVGDGLNGLANLLRRVNENWPGWPDIGMPDLPNWKPLLPELPDWDPLLPSLPDWEDLRPSLPDWSGIELNLPDWLTRFTDGSSDTIPAETNVGDIENQPGGGIMGGVPATQTGARVQRGGAARVHRGEIIADPDRLVSELADAVGQTSGGTTRRRSTRDMRTVERKLDEVNRNLKRLADSMPTFETVSDGDLARATERGSQRSLYDSDPQT